MAVGFPTDKGSIDARAGFLSQTIRDVLADASRMKTWLDGETTEALVARGYTEDDVALIKSAFTDLDKLNRIATGQATQADANDFFFWARRLTGLN